MSKEIELKLSLPAKALPALRRHPLVAAAAKRGATVTLDNTYDDTPDLTLKTRKVAVRTRRQGRRWLQTVKCAAPSTGGLSARPEWEQPYAGCFDFSAVDDPVTARLLAKHRDALVPVFTTRFRRETRVHAPGDDVEILLMIDRGEIIAGERSAPICELELELRSGQPADLLALACELADSLPLVPSDLSKAERGYRLFLDEPLRPLRAEPSPLTARMRPVNAFRELAAACLRQWQGNAAGAAASDAPEFIHQLRVALRRLRSLLHLFAPALPPAFVDEWNTTLRDTARRFGEARDLEVLYEELLAPVQASDVTAGDALLRLQALARDARDHARADALRNLDLTGQGRTMLAFSLALHRLPGDAPSGAADLTTFAGLQLARLRKKARKRFAEAADLTPAGLHALRIALKRLRYGVEFFAPLFPARQIRRYLETLTRAQRRLGFFNDVDMAHGRLESWADGDSELLVAAAFIAGWHARRHARLRHRILQEIKPLLRGPAPWTRRRRSR